jgi:methyl halide transferase
MKRQRMAVETACHVSPVAQVVLMDRDWEHSYQSGDTPWDKGSAAPPLAELIDLCGQDIWGSGPVLVPGCGTGHDVRLIARCGVEVWGVDIAPSAVAAAQGIPATGGEVYHVGDVLSPEWGDDVQFSAMWEHTCFCAIPPARRGDYAATAARVLPPGGLLAGVFYLQPWDPGDEVEGPPHGATQEEVTACFEPWFECVREWVPQFAYPGREGREWVALFRRLPNC